MTFSPIAPEAIGQAHTRIKPFTTHTPVLRSDAVDAMLGVHVHFKCENFQRIGAFKARGALNALLSLKENNALPQQVVAYSSGNHAQAVAYAAQVLGIKATLFIPGFASAYKIEQTLRLGAEVHVTDTRQEAEAQAAKMAAQGFTVIPPYDHDRVIEGQGTACFEALESGVKADAVFAPVGGGGLISGTLLASRLFSLQMQVYGAEPLLANDATRSYRTGKIHRLSDSPPTIADGARTLAVSERTLHYICQLQDMIEIEEEEMIRWVQLLAMHLKIIAEPTSCLAIAACARWAKKPENKGKTALIILSGGNTDLSTLQRIFSAG
jgi:threonine dehydratase